MRTILTAAIVSLLAATQSVFAQNVDPDIRGPARRAAGAAAEALRAPGVEDRIERRQMRRDARQAGPNSWRMRYYNDEWWYYTPQNNWVYHRDDRWVPYDQGSYRPLQRRTTGYRGTADVERRDRMAYGSPGPPDLTIGIHDGYFEPAEIRVSPGTTIRWRNQDAEDHTVTARNETWDSGEIRPDGAYSARFKEPGVYPYYCDLHPDMVGTIVVGDAQAADAAGQPADADVRANPEPGADDVDGKENPQPADAEVDVNVNPERGAADVDAEPPQSTPAPAPNPEPATPDPQ